MSAPIRDRFLIRTLGLVPERIAFVRHLIATGRVTDGPPPPVVVDAPVVLPLWDVPARPPVRRSLTRHRADAP